MELWDVDAALNRLTSEKAWDGIDLTDQSQSNVNDTMRRLLREAGPVATLALVHLAQYSDSEHMRYKAATYIIDRNLGRIGELTTTPERDPFMALLEDCVLKVEIADNQSS